MGEQKAVVKIDKTRLKGLLEDQKELLKAAFPINIDVNRFVQLATTAILNTPGVLACTQISILKSVMEVAELGLTLDRRLGHAFIVPFNDSKTGTKIAQPIIGYKGYIFLALQSGKVDKIDARVVREGDEFEVRYGLDENLIHSPTGDFDNKIIGSYAVATLTSGRKQFVHVPRKLIDKIRKAAPSKNSPAWNNWFEAMCEKTAINQLADQLALKELSRAVSLNRESELGGWKNVTPVESNTAAKTTELKERLASAKEEPEEIVNGEIVDTETGEIKEQEEPTEEVENCTDCGLEFPVESTTTIPDPSDKRKKLTLCSGCLSSRMEGKVPEKGNNTLL